MQTKQEKTLKDIDFFVSEQTGFTSQMLNVKDHSRERYELEDLLNEMFHPNDYAGDRRIPLNCFCRRQSTLTGRMQPTTKGHKRLFDTSCLICD